MKVILAGMPKTGTKSMNAALTRLGYTVYDFIEHVYYLGDDMNKIVLEGWTAEDFRRMYQGVDAVVDFPAHYFWDEIHKAFPDAKIILSMRENEDVWVKSMAHQMEMNEASLLVKALIYLSATHRRALPFTQSLVHVALGIPPSTFVRRKAGDFNHDMLKKLYRAHNAYVLHTAPKDKLLVYQCKEGWEPLCNFLGVPVPDEPFPHKNKKGEIAKTWSHPIVKEMQKEAMFSAAALFTASISTGIVLYKFGVSRILNGIYEQAKYFLEKLYLVGA